MPILSSPLVLTAPEADGLRSAMRDVQVSITDYHRSSTGFVDAETLATPVRTVAAFVQVLNDVLHADFSDQAQYQTMFDPPQDPRVELIEAFRYVRNVGQHLLHPVRPDPVGTVGGIGLGFRTFARWVDIPPAVHARLRTSTQALKVHYDNHLRGKEVTGTLLDAARFFSEACPALVHRRSNGEWTGFPLRHQPGLATRLHPEEPEDKAEATRWMFARKPGGDLRVVCGCLYEETGPFVFGLTFTGRCALTPFFEHPDQVCADIARGFPYYEGDVENNTYWNEHLCDVGGEFPPTLCSREVADEWIGNPIGAPRTADEWTNFNSVDSWRDLLMLQDEDNPQGFLTLRERRLGASFPIR